MRGMRALRNFKPDRCYHLISRIANRAFYLTDEEACAFLEGKRPQDLEEVESRMREAAVKGGLRTRRGDRASSAASERTNMSRNRN